jgi:predicted amidohydrolase
MKIGIYQFQPVWSKKESNIEKISSTISDNSRVDMWVLPELCTTGYQFSSIEQIESLAEPFPEGKSASAISSLSKKIQSTIVIGVMERKGEKFYNSAVVFDKGEFIGVYRKMHLFWEEKKWFSPGNEIPLIFDLNGIKVGVMICFDWIFPEVARTLALKGAQIIAHPSNLVLLFCQNAMITRSIENRIFTATANRIGTESIDGKEPLTFTGKSQITSPKGKRLGILSDSEQGVLVVDINPNESLDKSVTPMNDIFNDRRPELYRI